MKRLFAWVVLALFCLLGREATACENAVNAEDESIESMRRAEAALENGDLRFARILADEAAAHRPDLRAAADSIHAVATARDPASTDEQLEAARLFGGTTPRDVERAFEIDARLPAYRDGAHRGLRNLYDQDLLGSAWAIAALARLEPGPTQAQLFETCRTRATEPARACVRELAAPPLVLFYGEPSTYVVAGGLFVGFLLVLLLRTRERRPWRGHLLRVQLAAALAGLGIVLGAAQSPYLSIGAMLVLYAVVLFVERSLFFRSVRRGAQPGLAFRPAGPDDDGVPIIALPDVTREEVLERVAGPESYRSSARAEPLLRIVNAQRRWGFAKAAACIVAVFLILLAFASLTMGTRRGAAVRSPLPSGLQM